MEQLNMRFFLAVKRKSPRLKKNKYKKVSSSLSQFFAVNSSAIEIFTGFFRIPCCSFDFSTIFILYPFNIPQCGKQDAKYRFLPRFFVQLYC
jgi:hypothetical protein